MSDLPNLSKSEVERLSSTKTSLAETAILPAEAQSLVHATPHSGRSPSGVGSELRSVRRTYPAKQDEASAGLKLEEFTPLSYSGHNSDHLEIDQCVYFPWLRRSQS